MQSKAVKILIKNQKGGVGKSLIAFWLAHGLALENKTVLLLTSDSQDNIPAFAGKSEEAKEMTKGLESWVKTGEGDTLELRGKSALYSSEKFKHQQRGQFKIYKLYRNYGTKSGLYNH